MHSRESEDKVDLHVHTSFSSDADHTPEAILMMARKAGLRAISICDHDAIQGSQVAQEASDDFEIEVVPNVEITSFLDGRELHVLGFFVDFNSPALNISLSKVRGYDEDRAIAIVEVLNNLGIDVSYEEAKLLSPFAAPKCSVIIKAAMINGRNDDLPLFQEYFSGKRADQPYHNFFLDHMRPGGLAFVEPITTFSSIDAIVTILGANGVPVLAHPGGSLRLLSEMSVIHRLRENGLEGLEVYSSYHSTEDEKLLASYAHRYSMAVTAGSDFHGTTVKPNILLGDLSHNSYKLIEDLRRRAG